MERCTGLDGKFRENCVVFHHVLLCRTCKSIRLRTWRDICNTIGIGCSCKKGCATRGCSCLKAEQKCGPGCSCCNCENTFNALIHVALEVEIETAGIETDEVEADEAQRQQYFNEIIEEAVSVYSSQ